MQPRWKTFEEQVRGVAELIFGKPCHPKQIAGINFDAAIEISELEIVLIEISLRKDLNKVREGAVRLTIARQSLSSEGILLRGYIVLEALPTASQVETAKSAKLTIGSISQFASLFFKFPVYQNARTQASFGSSIDPITGAIDSITYIPVKYSTFDRSKELTTEDIVDLIFNGKNVILLGEYGTGKSRCVRELFNILSKSWTTTFKFPFAVNLRECWGLSRADEIIPRGIYSLGLDDLAASAVRALNRDSLVLLLDGFDELGSQSWSTDESRLRQLRAHALAGVRDLVGKTEF